MRKQIGKNISLHLVSKKNKFVGGFVSVIFKFKNKIYYIINNIFYRFQNKHFVLIISLIIVLLFSIFLGNNTTEKYGDKPSQVIPYSYINDPIIMDRFKKHKSFFKSEMFYNHVTQNLHLCTFKTPFLKE